eukprot:5215045-Prymnesium_polylepis.1
MIARPAAVCSSLDCSVATAAGGIFTDDVPSDPRKAAKSRKSSLPSWLKAREVKKGWMSACVSRPSWFMSY